MNSEKSNIILIFALFWIRCFFPLKGKSFLTLFLFLWLSTLCIVCLGIKFWALILPCVLQASLICGLMSGINLEKFSVLTSNIFSVPLSLLLLVFSLYLCYTFCSSATVLGYSVLFLVFFFLCFVSFRCSYWDNLKLRDSFLSRVPCTTEPIKGIFHFYYIVFGV